MTIRKRILSMGCGALLLSATGIFMPGCGDAPPPGEQPSQEIRDVVVSIQAPDVASSSGTSARSVDALRTGSNLLNDEAARLLDYSFQDVRSIVIDVYNVTADRPLFNSYPLTLVPGSNTWSGTLPFLPRDTPLRFSARAYDGSTTPRELFNGTVQRTVSSDGFTVTISLTPYDNERELAIPRLNRVSLPAEVPSGGGNSVTVEVDATSGETLSFEVIPAQGGGDFFPRTGTFQLAGTAGAFVFQYSAPSISEDTTFTHTVEITNSRGNGVRTSFTTRVRRVGTTPGAINTGIRVEFSPVINSLIGMRIGTTSNVLWEAAVSDDTPESGLTYAWAFLPAGSFTPEPSFLASTTRTATLSNYATTISGRIQLDVTDGGGSRTRLFYTVPTNQFPDNPQNDTSGTNGLSVLDAGGNHTCALQTNGRIRCWGLNTSGQLGYGNTFSVGLGQAPSPLPFNAGDVPNLDEARQIAVGANHTCALFVNGLVACWGENEFGQLGINHTSDIGDTEAVSSAGYVNLGGNAVRIAAGVNHTCAILDTGRVRCWGYNNFGQLGYGHRDSIGDNELPFQVGDVPLTYDTPVRDIVAGGDYTCALFQDARVRCWGRNNFGQLGYGRSDNIGDNEVPLVAYLDFGGGRVMQLSAGTNHTCALLETGNLRCWGLNANGQLGYPGRWTNSFTYDNWGDAANETPVTAGDVNAGGFVLQVTAGGAHTCAILSTGGVRCWGLNTSGQLGYGDSTQRTAPPAANVNLSAASAVRISAGGNHTCALLTTGYAWCWGEGGSGQLGYGNSNDIGDNEQPSAGGNIRIIN